MKVNKPLVYIFFGQLLFSFIVGTILEFYNIVIEYSSIFYLFLCVANAGHFIEENYNKIWILESQVKNELKNSGESIKPSMDRNFFILFSHILVIIGFLYYIPIAINIFWAMIFGLTLSMMEIGNGIVHFGIFLKYRVNTGIISGVFQIFFGILVWITFIF
jgi:hypothetical protein